MSYIEFPWTALLVDDEEAVRMCLGDFLLTQGFDVEMAANGEEALQKIKESRPNVVITDIFMPTMSGIELLKALQEYDPTIPVILLTGYSDVRMAIEALRMGAFDFMLKPLEFQALRNRLSHLMRIQMLEHQAEQERKRAVLMGRMAAVGQLATGVAHEINNPICYLRGNAQILQSLLEQLRNAERTGEVETIYSTIDSLLRQSPELLGGIENGCERIRRITQGLSLFADGQHLEVPVATSLNACVDDAMFMMEEQCGDVELVTDFEEELPVVLLSRRGVTQALICLLANAVQAVRSVSEKRIRMETWSTPNGVRFAIEDSGPGIPPETQERVFEPFFTTREVNEGVGLGLSVAYGIIVTDHGGMLRLEKSILGGARFVFELPGMPVEKKTEMFSSKTTQA